MAKMYLESNNGGYDILITDERGNWWAANTDDGKYGDAELYCNGDTESDRIGKALANLRHEINEGCTYSADDWLYDFGNIDESIRAYSGKMTIDDIDNIVNYETNSFGDRVPIDHDITTWYEV